MGQPRVPVGEDGSAKYGQDLSHVRSCPAKKGAKITIDGSDNSKRDFNFTPYVKDAIGLLWCCRGQGGEDHLH